MWLLNIAFVFVLQDTGRLSVYKPGDGFNHGRLACGGTFTHEQNHIAYRKWHRVGCGRKVLVCAVSTGRCVLSRVMDAGPYGIYRPPLKHAVRDGRWKVWTKKEPPEGWKWRAVVDVSYKLWVLLGKPPFLSRVRIFLNKAMGSQKRYPAALPLSGEMPAAYQTLAVYNVGAAFYVGSQFLSWPEPLHKQLEVWPLLQHLFPF